MSVLLLLVFGDLLSDVVDATDEGCFFDEAHGEEEMRDGNGLDLNV